MAVLKFEEVYWISMTCLKLTRAHPTVPLDRKWLLQVGFMHGLLTVILSTILYSMIAVDIKEDITKTCSDGIFVVIWIMVTSQYGVMLWFKEHLRRLIRYTQEYFDLADSLPAEDQAVILKYANKGKWISKVWLVVYCSNGILFPIQALVFTLYSLHIGEFQLVPLYDNSFPSPIEEVKYRPDVYSVIFVCQVFYASYSILMYIGFCPLGPIFILNICAQLDLMANKVGTIFNHTPYNSEQTSREISVFIQDLQKIYCYVKLINDVFEVLYEITLKATSIMIPITFYQVIDSLKRGEMCLEYIAFIFSTAVICYVPCLYSDILMERGEELRLAMYRSNWEDIHDKNARASLLIMLTIAIRPISIRTIFRTVCLDAFAEACHQAYAIFNVISAARV